MRRFSLLIAVVFIGILFAGYARADKGSRACKAVEISLARKGVNSSCRYKDSGGNNWVYAVFIHSTTQNAMTTVGLALAAIIGVDPEVPHRTLGIGVSDNDKEYVYFDMVELRRCRVYIDNDPDFIACFAKISHVISID